MKILKGMISFKKPKMVLSEPIRNSSSMTTVFTNSQNKEDFLKKMLYACTSCGGPLVPVSNCTFCKRTFLRKCVRCGKTRDAKSHESCKILIYFGSSIVQKHNTENNL